MTHKTFITIIILAIQCCGGCNKNENPIIPTGTPEITFLKTYGGEKTDVIYSGQQTNDDGYILAGSTQSFGAVLGDGLLIKTDALGNQTWLKTFSGKYIRVFFGVQQTNDGGYILAGTTDEYGNGPSNPELEDFWLVKTDANGNEIWSKTFGGEFCDRALAMEKTLDGGFILAGVTNSYGNKSGDVWLVKTDANGIKLWDKIYHITKTQYVRTISKTNDGGYIILCNISNVQAQQKNWIIKTDNQGNILWDKVIGDGANDGLNSIIQTSDGNYIATGYVSKIRYNDRDLRILKMNSNGDTLWSKIYGGKDEDIGNSIEQTKDGNYIITGKTNSYGASLSSGIWVLKADTSGKLLWSMIISKPKQSVVSLVKETRNNGIFIIGSTNSYGTSGTDALFVKIDFNNCDLFVKHR